MDQEKEINKVGRPKTPLDLPEGWQEEILKLYKEGASDVEVKAWIWEARGRFSNGLWNGWMNREKEFKKTIKLGRALSHAWWEKTGRTHIMDQYTETEKGGMKILSKISPAMWFMNMKNRHAWSDKVNLKSEDTQTVNITIDHGDAELLGGLK